MAGETISMQSAPGPETAADRDLSRDFERRSKAPVFVLGCGRSGTTLLYHMLLSSGNFAIYRTESNVINLLEPRFGNLRRPRNQRRLLDAWYGSRLYTLSGLQKTSLEARVKNECRNGGDFLRIIMEEMARQQGVERWADTTPEHLLHLHRIKETIPNALVIHIIRDGRDVALSTAKQGYIRALRGDSLPATMVSALYWEWMVEKGRRDGRDLGNDYAEVRFEELVERPHETLSRLGKFIGQPLDYEQIRHAGVGSVSSPNSSFAQDPAQEFNPAGRWKSAYTQDELATLEALVGETLVGLGYELGAQKQSDRPDLRRKRKVYRAYFDGKLYLKAKTPLGRLMVTRDLSWI